LSANGRNAKAQGKPAQKSRRPAPSERKGQPPRAAGQKGRTAPTANERRRREISGIALIALGLFLALTHLGSTGVVGEKVTGFTFGLTGVFAYVLPIILIAQGFYAIATAGKKAALPRFMLIVAVMLMALSFIHIFFMDRIQPEGYIDFLWKSFALGESVEAGGGLLGGLLSYPAVALLGKGGSYVLFPALALMLIVALTNISLQRTGEGGQGHQTERRCRFNPHRTDQGGAEGKARAEAADCRGTLAAGRQWRGAEGKAGGTGR